jgi:hypothetical protein
MTDTAVALRREFAPITIPNTQKLLDRIKNDIADANDIDVCSAAMAEEAQELIGRIAKVQDELDAERLATTKPLRDGAAWVNEGYNPAIVSLDTTVKSVKVKLQAWSKIVAERKREAEAEEARQRKVRADKLEADAEEQRKASAELQRKADEAAAAGNTAGAVDLFEQAALADNTARSAESAAAQIVAAPMHIATGGSGVKGERKVWKGRVLDKAALLLAAANRPELRSLFDVNESLLNALAKTNQDQVLIPGVEFYEDEIIATRRK